MADEQDKRRLCQHCCFLISMCVCPWRPTVSTRLHILVLQDPKEAKHAKNTVTLLQLALPLSVECVSIADQANVGKVLQEKDPAKWRLLFPSDNAMPVESLSLGESTAIEGLIVLDATWRKAKKLYFTESLLQAFQSISFEQPPASQYAIRKAPKEGALSTLEACAYAIETIAKEDMQPLRNFMVAAQNLQWRQQPEDHRQSR
ncbi:DTW domain-containing protein [Marinomonas sp. A79]|uniref:tRNA-uridine aminocarboxypropyltransferase n=1 Tax=Marinomonas vulgaris TaxID=2823372 RepID=A0ABS5H824_9GAMM|nr:tRNA-uridine aminocarboxypropyltransferase [Marinomonas vulgaris]MBR7887848.1 DTW domain-containing protein [Marinomonas vulgaris]